MHNRTLSILSSTADEDMVMLIFTRRLLGFVEASGSLKTGLTWIAKDEELAIAAPELINHVQYVLEASPNSDLLDLHSRFLNYNGFSDLFKLILKAHLAEGNNITKALQALVDIAVFELNLRKPTI